MFLNLVHLRDVRCALCDTQLAAAGSRSFIVDANGDPVNFSSDDPPAEMVVEIACPNGHLTQFSVPGEIGAEESLQTPEEAPIGADARMVSGTTESGRDFSQ
jgi:hypothetical protein